jgi:hypothetical protein
VQPAITNTPTSPANRLRRCQKKREEGVTFLIEPFPRPHHHDLSLILVEYAVEEYGPLATALHDEGLINFDYVVKHIPVASLRALRTHPGDGF